MLKIPGAPRFFNRQIPFRPWVYFLTFFAANSLLSYVPLSLTAKLEIGLGGIGLPMGFATWTIIRNKRSLKSTRLASPDPLALSPHWDSVPAWLWVSFLLLLLFSRFFRLVDYPFWPTGDEGIVSNLAMSLLDKWDGRLLWGELQMEPLSIWLLGVFFKVVPPSLWAIRLFPVLVSLSTVVSAYWACRQYCSKGFSFLFTWLYAFSFFALMLSRSCIPNILPPLFEFWVFGLLGKFLKEKNNAYRWGWILGLGFLNGAGFYTYTNWIGVAMMACWVLAFFILETDKDFYRLAFFLLVTVLVALPLLRTRLSPGGTAHIQAMFDDRNSITPYYLIGLFWNGLGTAPIGPAWGGLMNAEIGALIFTGIFIFLQTTDLKVILGWACMIGLGFLPGSMTHSLNLLRISQIVPFLTVFAVLALEKLASHKKPGRSWVLVSGILLAGLVLDFYHYSGPYTDPRYVPFRGGWRARELYHAYQILESEARKSGPFYLFSEFNTDYNDKTLNIACYPSDALQNPRLALVHPTWVAVQVNIRYVTYFQKAFPHLRYEAYDPDYAADRNLITYGLFLIPVKDISPTTLKRWQEADRFYRKINLSIKKKSPSDSWGEFVRQLKVFEDRYPEDSFLTAVFWEKYAFFELLAKDNTAAARAYEYAIKKGWPTSHLYFQWGLALRSLEKNEEAAEAFKEARALSKN